MEGTNDVPPEPRTYSGEMMRALDLYWFGGQPDVAMQIIGILMEWRAECSLLAMTGEDGAL